MKKHSPECRDGLNFFGITMEKIVLEQLRRKFMDNEIPLGIKKKLRIENLELEAYPEPWTLACFTSYEIRQVKDEHDLENLALIKSEQIAKKEGWDGSLYFYPDQTGEPYGVTLFYKIKH